jgi:hypothetical protein
MLRVPIDKAWIKRPLRIEYGWTQATPKAVLLDPAWDRSVDIYPGMVGMRTSGDLVTLINATGVPYGLFGNYIGGDTIDEVADSGVNATSVWVLGPDAEFEVNAPAFDASASWVDPGDGTFRLIHAYVDGALRGQLCPAGVVGHGTVSALPVAKLLAVESANTIKIGGLSPVDV